MNETKEKELERELEKAKLERKKQEAKQRLEIKLVTYKELFDLGNSDPTEEQVKVWIDYKNTTRNSPTTIDEANNRIENKIYLYNRVGLKKRAVSLKNAVEKIGKTERENKRHNDLISTLEEEVRTYNLLRHPEKLPISERYDEEKKREKIWISTLAALIQDSILRDKEDYHERFSMILDKAYHAPKEIKKTSIKEIKQKIFLARRLNINV